MFVEQKNLTEKQVAEKYNRHGIGNGSESQMTKALHCLYPPDEARQYLLVDQNPVRTGA